MEKRTTVVPDLVTGLEAGSVDVTVADEPAARVRTDDPARKTVERETTTPRTPRP